MDGSVLCKPYVVTDKDIEANKGARGADKSSVDAPSGGATAGAGAGAGVGAGVPSEPLLPHQVAAHGDPDAEAALPTLLMPADVAAAKAKKKSGGAALIQEVPSGAEPSSGISPPTPVAAVAASSSTAAAAAASATAAAPSAAAAAGPAVPSTTLRVDGDKYIVEVHLPGLTSMADVELDVSATIVSVAAPGFSKAVEALPDAADHAAATAKFKRRKGLLTVTVPMAAQ